MDLRFSERARRIQERLDALAAITDEPGIIFRMFLSPAMCRANASVAAWMAEAGLATREDMAGNVVGVEREPAGRPVLLLGSHLDTVRNAGRFDGPLGVLLAIEAVAALRESGATLAVSPEVYGFSDEEGVRFQSAYLGSKALSGLLGEDDLALRDPSGTTLRQALEKFSGSPVDPVALRRPGLPPLGYVEVHIEQGPVLESEGLAVGVVEGIAGQTRIKVEWTGRAAHAGTTPPELRRDALTAAAAFVLEAEAAMKGTPGLRATVGTLDVFPNVGNVVPSRVVHSLDVRHLDDGERIAACRRLQERALALARERSLEVAWSVVQDNGAVACDPRLSQALAISAAGVTGKERYLPSGAGHDGVAVSRLCPVAMLFVRCRGGVSHHPDEYTSVDDIAVALETLCDFLRTLAP
jgi:allantoate deiminase